MSLSEERTYEPSWRNDPAYRREQARREEAYQRQLQAAEARARKQAEAAMRKREADISARMQKETERLQKENANTRRQLEREIGVVNASLENARRERANDRREWRAAQRRTEQEIAAFRNEVDEALTTQEREIRANEQRINRMEQDQNALRSQANDQLQAARCLYEMIGEYRTELLLPGRKQELGERINEARENVQLAASNPANSSVALSAARRAHAEAIRLYADVRAREAIWQEHFTGAETAIAAAENLIGEAESAVYRDAAGEAEVNVDAFTGGGRAALADQLGFYRGCLESERDRYTAEDLDGIRGNAERIMEEANRLREFAVDAFMLSQDRADISQRIADEAAALGLTVQRFAYQGGDYAAGCALLLTNPQTGLQILVTQEPVEDGESLSNGSLRAEVLDYGTATNDEEAGNEVVGQIFAGLGLGGPVTRQTCVDRGLVGARRTTDMERFEKETPNTPSYRPGTRYPVQSGGRKSPLVTGA